MGVGFGDEVKGMGLGVVDVIGYGGDNVSDLDMGVISWVIQVPGRYREWPIHTLVVTDDISVHINYHTSL